MNLSSLLWLLALAILPSSGFAQKGVLIFKDAPWDTDQFAHAMPYKRVDKFPTVYNVEPVSGPKVQVKSALVLKDISFPDPAALADITEEPQVKGMEALITDWTATLKHFPQATKLLNSRISDLQANIAQFRGGKVKVAGVWMTPDALLAQKKQVEQERQRIAAKLAAEARARDLAAQEWENLDEAGRKRMREAKEADLRAAEDRRIEEEIKRQEQIAAHRALMKPGERLATDSWMTPELLKPEQVGEYEAALKDAREQLAKAKENIGFGRESQRMVIVTPECVYAFKPGDIKPEVTMIPAEPKPDQIKQFTLDSIGKKEAIETFPTDGSEPARTSSVIVTTTTDVDAQKLQESLSHLLALCAAKREKPVELEAPAPEASSRASAQN